MKKATQEDLRGIAQKIIGPELDTLQSKIDFVEKKAGQDTSELRRAVDTLRQQTGVAIGQATAAARKERADTETLLKKLQEDQRDRAAQTREELRSIEAARVSALSEVTKASDNLASKIRDLDVRTKEHEAKLINLFDRIARLQQVHEVMLARFTDLEKISKRNHSDAINRLSEAIMTRVVMAAESLDDGR